MDDQNPPKPIGRPLAPIDWAQFDSLIQMHCTINEIAFFFKCSRETIERRVKDEKGMTFVAYFEHMSVGGRLSLRRIAWKKAIEQEETATLHLLLKQKESRGGLGFSDKVTNEVDLSGKLTLEDIVSHSWKDKKKK